ncbi:MAG: carcinine hydrolase/isopenicillin-N N-acyltransferase family protein [Candidatus Heimdallarchaeaceae archaeon]
MKKKEIKRETAILLLLIISFITIPMNHIQADNAPEFQGTSCTNFSARFGEVVLFGNSEDASGDHPLFEGPEGSYVFVYPNSSAGYGCVFLGWYWQDTHVSVQGGMNEVGLCYDSTAVPDMLMNPHPERPYKMGEDWLSGKILRECSSVSEAIELVNNFEFESLWFQLFLTDANGDSVILSPGSSGEIEVTELINENGYLAQTNFNRVCPESYYGKYPCPRYEDAANLLNTIESENNITVDFFEDILEAVHIEKIGGYTAYSNICDPKNKMMYINFASQFNEMVSINITEELTKGERGIKLTTLFSEETVENGVDLYMKYKKLYSTTITLVSIGTVLILATLCSGVIILIRRKKKNTTSLL